MKKAFTLLEMLVVIGLISIVVTLGFASYSTAQKKGRDAKRKSDLSSFQSCMEQYYADNNNFKYSVTANIDPIESDDSFACGGTNTMTIEDPLNNSTYKYALSNTDATDQDSYTICTTLETETPASYCVSNLQ